jgi:hypothetical protein
MAALLGTPAVQEIPDPPALSPDEPRGVPHPKLVHTLRHKQVDAVVFRSGGRRSTATAFHDRYFGRASRDNRG